MRILVVNDYDGLYSLFWEELGEATGSIREFMVEPERFGLVCFTGGEDVSPELYGHRNFQSHASIERDKRETLIFEVARKHEIPMTGICRGSQFLNVMCGGTMVQHLAKSHGGNPHQCVTYEALFAATSSHHQMSVLGPGGVYLGWSRETLSPDDCVYDGDLRGQNICWDLFKERKHFHVTEAFAYLKQRIFAVQHHPEWQKIDEEAPQWTLRKIRELLLEETESAAEGSA